MYATTAQMLSMEHIFLFTKRLQMLTLTIPKNPYQLKITTAESFNCASPFSPGHCRALRDTISHHVGVNHTCFRTSSATLQQITEPNHRESLIGSQSISSFVLFY